jgi:hypothetical protein
MEKTVYKIYVEGGLHDTTLTLAKAIRIREKAESEGWNVKVTKCQDTILGTLEVEVDL